MTREDVLREFTSEYEWADLGPNGEHLGIESEMVLDTDAMADRIVALEAALAAAPKVTRVLDEYRIFDGYGHVLNTVEGTREYAHNLAQSYRIRPYTEHPVTVRRVALLEDNNNNN